MEWPKRLAQLNNQLDIKGETYKILYEIWLWNGVYVWEKAILLFSLELIERPYFLSVSGIGVKIKSVSKYFWFLVLNFTTPMYTLLFLNFEIYIVHVINWEWSRFVNFPLRMFCMRYKPCFSNKFIFVIQSIYIYIYIYPLCQMI